MRLNRYPWRRNAAIIAVSACLAAVGIGGVVSANADSSPNGSSSQVEKSDGDGEQNDATEKAEPAGSDGETNDDATDTGPDANPNEPGHQDASDTASTE